MAITPADPQGSTYQLAKHGSIAAQPLELSDNSRVYGRQISAGNIRGNQNITGTFTVLDISSATPIVSIDGTNDYMLVTDPDTKINRIVIGKLPDGNFGMVVSKPGIDVLTTFT